MKKSPRKKRSGATTPLLRFAHPFFHSAEKLPTKHFGSQMLNYIQGRLQPIPPPRTSPPFTLDSIIGAAGAAEIQASGTILFHTAGDTGLTIQPAETPQEMVAASMAKDYDLSHPARSPAFFFHLGDVVYGPHKDQNYRTQFYEPYMHYPGKIIAIAGNHDGETFPVTDPITCKGFLENFCTPKPTLPPIAGSVFRQTMTQPGVYWLLDAPFVQIVGLYSNTAENPGFISGAIPGAAQKDWLIATLKKVAAQRAQGHRKALLFATHHPPFSSGGHSGSTGMLADIDSACKAAGVYPDAFFSGHAHSYQRYTRTLTAPQGPMQIPYFVVGCGGHGNQPVPVATGQVTGDHSFDVSYRGYGYALVSVSPQRFQLKFFAVANDTSTLYDTLTLDLKSNRIVKS